MWTNNSCFFHHLIMIVMAVFVVVPMITACGRSNRPKELLDASLQLKKVHVVGHRGAAGLVPENTLASIKKALQIGVDAVELDLLLTADGEVIVHHDYFLKPEITRTLDGAWLDAHAILPINEQTLAELKTYDVGRLKPFTRYSRRYPDQQPVDGEHIPTLREVIRLFKNSSKVDTQLWLEIKTNPERPNLTPTPETVADKVLTLLKTLNVVERVRILSFDWRSLVHIQKSAPNIPTVYLSFEGRSLNNIKPGQPGASPWMAGIDIDDFNGAIPKAVFAAGGRYWAPYYKHLTYDLLRIAHQMGLKVFVWTPNDRYDMRRLIEMGVDGIIMK